MNKDINQNKNEVKKDNHNAEPIFRISFNKNKPNIDATIEKMQALVDYYGVPFNGEMLNDFIETNFKLDRELNKKVIKMFNDRVTDREKPLTYIDYTGRKISPSNKAHILCQYLGLDETRYRDELKGTYVFRKEDLEYNLEKFKNILAMSTNEEERKYNQDNVDFIQGIMDVMEARRMMSSTNQLVDGRREFEKATVEKAKKEFPDKEIKTFSDVKPLLADPDIFYVYPTLNKTDTGRITTSDPNIQGKTEGVKETMQAPKGYKIASMDLKGQEVHILIWGILDNPDIKELYFKYKEPYRAILETAGYEYNQELRDNTKDIILGMMNGKKESTALSEIPQADLVRNVYKLITQDPGYKRIVTSYAETNSKSANPMRKSLFGSLLPANTRNLRYKSSLENQLKNGFFQLTASEIVSLSIDAFMSEISKEIGVGNCRILVPIYDEFVIIYKEEYEEYAIEKFEQYFKPVIEDWPRFLGTPKIGHNYQA